MLRAAAVSLLLGVALLLGGGSAWAAAATPAPGAEGRLTLARAVELTLSRNERAKVSDLQVDVADAAVERAFTAFLPVLSTQASGTQHASALRSPSDTGTASVTVTQPIVDASAFPLYAQARRLADAQRAQSADDKRSLAFAAATAYFAVLGAQDVVAAAQRQLDTARVNLATTQARAQAQLSSTNDVTKAQVDLAAAQREAAVDQGALGSAVVQLSFTMNAPVALGLAPPEETLEAAARPVGSADALVSVAVERRPDVLAAKYQAEAARDFASEPMLRFVPALNVQGQAVATTTPSPFTGRHDDETVTATLSWTLYDAGVRYADKHARDAQAEIADLDVSLLLRTVDAQVRSAAALLAAAQGAFRSASDAAAYAKQNVEETAILYRQGLSTALDLVTTNDSRFAAEVGYAGARYAMAQAYLGLRQALGLDVLGTELR